MPDVFSNEGQESTKNCSEMPLQDVLITGLLIFLYPCRIRDSTQICSPHFPRKEPHFDHFEMAMDEKNKAISENYWDINGHGMNCLNCYAVWFHRLLVGVG